MVSQREESKEKSVIERHLEKRIVVALIVDPIYILIAMIMTRLLSMAASWLGMANDSWSQYILHISGSFYIVIYLMSVIKSIIHIALDEIEELLEKWSKIASLMEEKK
jgi:hypothetical protein